MENVKDSVNIRLSTSTACTSGERVTRSLSGGSSSWGGVSPSAPICADPHGISVAAMQSHLQSWLSALQQRAVPSSAAKSANPQRSSPKCDELSYVLHTCGRVAEEEVRDYDTAEEYFRQALEVCPNNVDALSSWAQSAARRCGNPNPSSRQLTDDAFEEAARRFLMALEPHRAQRARTYKNFALLIMRWRRAYQGTLADHVEEKKLFEELFIPVLTTWGIGGNSGVSNVVGPSDDDELVKQLLRRVGESSRASGRHLTSSQEKKLFKMTQQPHFRKVVLSHLRPSPEDDAINDNATRHAERAAAEPQCTPPQWAQIDPLSLLRTGLALDPFNATIMTVMAEHALEDKHEGDGHAASGEGHADARLAARRFYLWALKVDPASPEPSMRLGTMYEDDAGDHFAFTHYHAPHNTHRHPAPAPTSSSASLRFREGFAIARQQVESEQLGAKMDAEAQRRSSLEAACEHFGNALRATSQSNATLLQHLARRTATAAEDDGKKHQGNNQKAGGGSVSSEGNQQPWKLWFQLGRCLEKLLHSALIADQIRFIQGRAAEGEEPPIPARILFEEAIQEEDSKEGAAHGDTAAEDGPCVDWSPRVVQYLTSASFILAPLLPPAARGATAAQPQPQIPLTSDSAATVLSLLFKTYLCYAEAKAAARAQDLYPRAKQLRNRDEALRGSFPWLPEVVNMLKRGSDGGGPTRSTNERAALQQCLPRMVEAELFVQQLKFSYNINKRHVHFLPLSSCPSGDQMHNAPGRDLVVVQDTTAGPAWSLATMAATRALHLTYNTAMIHFRCSNAAHGQKKGFMELATATAIKSQAASTDKDSDVSVAVAFEYDAQHSGDVEEMDSFQDSSRFPTELVRSFGSTDRENNNNNNTTSGSPAYPESPEIKRTFSMRPSSPAAAEVRCVYGHRMVAVDRKPSCIFRNATWGCQECHTSIRCDVYDGYFCRWCRYSLCHGCSLRPRVSHLYPDKDMLIGTGGCAKVFRVFDAPRRCYVAEKRSTIGVKATGCSGPGGGDFLAAMVPAAGSMEAVATFQHEIAMLTKVRHDHIISIIGLGNDSGGGDARAGTPSSHEGGVNASFAGSECSFEAPHDAKRNLSTSRSGLSFRMELAAGSVHDVVSRFAAPIAEGVAAVWMKHALSAVAHLHQKKIVHRDLKPQNFLLCAGSGESKASELVHHLAPCLAEEYARLVKIIGKEHHQHFERDWSVLKQKQQGAMSRSRCQGHLDDLRHLLAFLCQFLPSSDSERANALLTEVEKKLSLMVPMEERSSPANAAPSSSPSAGTEMDPVSFSIAFPPLNTVGLLPESGDNDAWRGAALRILFQHQNTTKNNKTTGQSPPHSGDSVISPLSVKISDFGVSRDIYRDESRDISSLFTSHIPSLRPKPTAGQCPPPTATKSSPAEEDPADVDETTLEGLLPSSPREQLAQPENHITKFAGTYEFAAPEAVLGGTVGRMTCTADMWSLGATWLYMLTGGRIYTNAQLKHVRDVCGGFALAFDRDRAFRPNVRFLLRRDPVAGVGGGGKAGSAAQGPATTTTVSEACVVLIERLLSRDPSDRPMAASILKEYASYFDAFTKADNAPANISYAEQIAKSLLTNVIQKRLRFALTALTHFENEQCKPKKAEVEKIEERMSSRKEDDCQNLRSLKERVSHIFHKHEENTQPSSNRPAFDFKSFFKNTTHLPRTFSTANVNSSVFKGLLNEVEQQERSLAPAPDATAATDAADHRLLLEYVKALEDRVRTLEATQRLS